MCVIYYESTLNTCINHEICVIYRTRTRSPKSMIGCKSHKQEIPQSLLKLPALNQVKSVTAFAMTKPTISYANLTGEIVAAKSTLKSVTNVSATTKRKIPPRVTQPRQLQAQP